MRFGPALHLRAGLASAIDKMKQAADLVDAKAEFARPEDEAQAADVGFVIDAITAGAARRVG